MRSSRKCLSKLGLKWREIVSGREEKIWEVKAYKGGLFFSFGATAHIWALAYLHETFRFTSVY
jgi:hypothetical protein